VIAFQPVFGVDFVQPPGDEGYFLFARFPRPEQGRPGTGRLGLETAQ
jgi:hypothetical protein